MPTTTPPLLRFFRHVNVQPNGCWLWTGSTTGNSRRRGKPYGLFRATSQHNGPKVKAYRWIYEQQVGPIPAGLTIDHKCQTPLCVNWTHLEPVTQAENNRRRYRLPGTPEGAHVCASGHDLSAPDSTYPNPSRPSSVGRCRACVKAASRRSYEKRKRAVV